MTEPTDFPLTKYNKHLPHRPKWIKDKQCRLPLGWNPLHYKRPTSAFHWAAMIASRMETIRLMRDGATVSEVEKSFLTGYLSSCICEEEIQKPDTYKLRPSYNIQFVTDTLSDNIDNSWYSENVLLMIDVNSDDASLKKSFSDLLAIIRKEMNKDINLRRKSLTRVTDKDLDDWFRKRLAQLIDITLWSELTKQKYTQSQKFEYVYGDLDLSVDAKDALQKTYLPLMNFVFSDQGMSLLQKYMEDKKKA